MNQDHQQPLPVSELFDLITKRIDSGEVVLPGVPIVLTRVRNEMRKEDASFKTMARVIEIDPSMSAWLLRTANSALYRTARKAETVSSAVARLGLDGTRNLVTVFAVKNLIQVKRAPLKEKVHEIWKASVKRAAIASILAEKLRGFDTEKALLAALLQDIGALVLLAEAERAGGIASHEIDRVDELLAQYSPWVGLVMLTKWELGDDWMAVITSSEDYRRDLSPEPDLADLVLAARVFAQLGGERFPKWPAEGEVPAIDKLGGNRFTNADIRDIIENSRKRISEVMSSLGG
jgi:HD-like signal output (HDOD) protein